MDRKTYRKVFDEISFSADFQERTAALLRARKAEKENKTMTFGKMKKMALLTAAAVALLAISVSAATLWLSPSQAAEDLFDQPLLARAFEDEDALIVNETVETGGFMVTLLGAASGEDLDVLGNTDTSRTYAVLALQRLDGTPLEQQDFDFIRYTFTPLISGYEPWRVNNWTLDASAQGASLDGVFYYLLDVQNLEMFADRTVYLAFYEGGAPSADSFTVQADGSISFSEDFEGPHALFTLPLDESLADPAAAEAFLAEYGLQDTEGSDSEPEGQVSPDDVQFHVDGIEDGEAMDPDNIILEGFESHSSTAS